MPTNGAQQRGRDVACKYDGGISQAADKQCTAARHGTRTAYAAGCRCPAARAACAAAQRSWQKRRYLAGGPLLIDVTGTRRRVQALVAIGWDQNTIGRRLGHDQRWVANLIRRRTIFRHNALAITALYDQLADHPGPSKRARTVARKAGWLPPLAWDEDTIDDPNLSTVEMRKFILHDCQKQPHQDAAVDPVAIDRYLAGDTTIRLNRAEKRCAFYNLRATGHSVTAAATQLGLSGSTARRYEAARPPLNVTSAADTLPDTDLEETG